MKAEAFVANAMLGDRFQFERVGAFRVDPDSLPAISSSTAPSRSKTPGPGSRKCEKPAYKWYFEHFCVAAAHLYVVVLVEWDCSEGRSKHVAR
jgi:hypothetical protein